MGPWEASHSREGILWERPGKSCFRASCPGKEAGLGCSGAGTWECELWENVVLELGLPFKQSLSWDFPTLGVLHFTIFSWILGWGGSAELCISILYEAGATLLQLFSSFLGCIYHQTCKKSLELLL